MGGYLYIYMYKGASTNSMYTVYTLNTENYFTSFFA